MNDNQSSVGKHLFPKTGSCLVNESSGHCLWTVWSLYPLLHRMDTIPLGRHGNISAHPRLERGTQLRPDHRPGLPACQPVRRDRRLADRLQSEFRTRLAVGLVCSRVGRCCANAGGYDLVLSGGDPPATAFSLPCRWILSCLLSADVAGLIDAAECTAEIDRAIAPPVGLGDHYDHRLDGRSEEHT